MIPIDPTNAAINEPFSSKRELSRLLFDFSIALSCIKSIDDNNHVLEFACGTGWLSEFLNRAGYDVTAFDVSGDVIDLAKHRSNLDKRISPDKLNFFVSDGHLINEAKTNFYSNIFCFDSLHHMSDFEKVFEEMARILITGGRAIFVEPGSRHSESAETKAFIEQYKKDDPTWIERSIYLEEINSIAIKYGFEPIRVKPFLFPSMVDYSLNDFLNFGDNKEGQANYISNLLRFNSQDRVIFYMDKK